MPRLVDGVGMFGHQAVRDFRHFDLLAHSIIWSRVSLQLQLQDVVEEPEDYPENVPALAAQSIANARKQDREANIQGMVAKATARLANPEQVANLGAAVVSDGVASSNNLGGPMETATAHQRCL